MICPGVYILQIEYLKVFDERTKCRGGEQQVEMNLVLLFGGGGGSHWGEDRRQGKICDQRSRGSSPTGTAPGTRGEE